MYLYIYFLIFSSRSPKRFGLWVLQSFIWLRSPISNGCYCIHVCIFFYNCTVRLLFWSHVRSHSSSCRKTALTLFYESLGHRLYFLFNFGLPVLLFAYSVWFLPQFSPTINLAVNILRNCFTLYIFYEYGVPICPVPCFCVTLIQGRLNKFRCRVWHKLWVSLAVVTRKKVGSLISGPAQTLGPLCGLTIKSKVV